MRASLEKRISEAETRRKVAGALDQEQVLAAMTDAELLEIAFSDGPPSPIRPPNGEGLLALSDVELLAIINGS